MDEYRRCSCVSLTDPTKKWDGQGTALQAQGVRRLRASGCQVSGQRHQVHETMKGSKTGVILCDKWCICNRVGKGKHESTRQDLGVVIHYHMIGSFGELYFGRNIETGTHCAIKVQNEDIGAGLRVSGIGSTWSLLILSTVGK